MSDDTPILAIAIVDNYDPNDMEPVFAAMPEAVQPYLDDFTLINSDGSFDSVEGLNPQSVVVTRWPSRKIFDEYWNSEAHQRVRAMRDGIASFTLLIVPDLTRR